MGKIAGRKVVGTGGEVLVEQAKAAGVRYLFTNPGSAEAAFFDALVEAPDIQLIMGLHEGIVIALADGYAKAKGDVGFVNVHTIGGTGQMAGQLYNAFRDGTPLVVTAGMPDNEYYTDLVGLAASPGFNQKEVNRQFTKISWEIRNPEAIALSLRRAFKVSTANPPGPTYVAYSNYALEAPNVEVMVYPREQFEIAPNAAPDPRAIETLAEKLLSCKQPVLFVGDEVWKAGAQAEAVVLAETLGAVVTHGSDAFRNFPTQHPYYYGFYRGVALPEGADLFLSIGGKATGGWGERENDNSWPILDYSAAMGMNLDHMGRNYPMDLAIMSNVKTGMRALIDCLRAMSSPQSDTRRSARQEDLSTRAAVRQQHHADWLKQNFSNTVIHPVRLSYECEQALEPGTIFVNEHFTADHSPIHFGYRQSEKEKMWLGTSGGSLGWGVGAAIGAKIARPDTPVFLSIGDGSTMYSSSAFWTMARYGVPVLTVVWNDFNYQTVRHAFHRLGGVAARTNKYPGMFLGDPQIDFAMLAKSQGVQSERVTENGQIAAALKRGMDATKRGEPYLIDVVISRVGGGADSTWHQQFNLAMQGADIEQ
ncbi:MAG: thiamine pyrophosphate-binding protein [Chloroflexi bacterium]|nr:thiamine pyrophosphate-binding protein [Chloroflexota bacterium]